MHLLRSVGLLAAFAVLYLNFGCQRDVRVSPVGPPSSATRCNACAYYDDFAFPGLPYGTTIGGEWVIQTQADWDAYLAKVYEGVSSYYVPATMPLPPVDLATKTLILKFPFVSCNDLLTAREICVGPDRVTVRFQIDQQCCRRGGYYYFYITPSPMAFAIDKTDKPIVWELTYIPYEGPPCPVIIYPPIWYYTADTSGGFTSTTSNPTPFNPVTAVGGK